MAKRCGCASDTCGCTFSMGPGFTIEGSGNHSDPYVLSSPTPPPAYLSVVDTPQIDLELTGVGTVEDPYVLTGTASADAAEISTTIFLTDGTWTKPSGKQIVTAYAVGGGGGGGGGAYTSATYTGGGWPGGGGGLSMRRLLASDLAATIDVVVGPGGSGAPGRVPGDVNTAATNGTAGSNSSFGTWCIAGGGWGGGAVQTAALARQVAGERVMHSQPFGTDPGGYPNSIILTGTDTALVNTDGERRNGGAAGGQGYGGSPSQLGTPVLMEGSAGKSNLPANVVGGAAGVFSHGQPGLSPGTGMVAGGSGGGGADTSSATTNGGAGGFPGGGGGGGAGKVSAGPAPGGTGGNGAAGVVIVKSW